MIRVRAALLLCGLAAAAAGAHEGETHRQPAATPLSATAPHRLPDGALFLPKPAQRLLGIRTRTWPIAGGAARTLLAEVQARPGAAQAVTAGEPGRLQAAAGGWPLPGQAVRAGQVLAWLHPALGQRDAARRRALAAELEQKLVISNLNVDRLGLQNAVNGDQQVSSGNIYLEQATAERDALRRERGLLLDSLADRVPLRASASGRLLAAPVREGEVVATGQVLFELADPARLRLVATHYEPGLGAKLRGASARSEGGGAWPLLYRGEEPLAGAPGWRLLFDLPGGDTQLSPGQLLEVQIDAAGEDAGLPAAACAIDAAGAAQIWVHREAERFVPIHLPSCSPGAVAAGALASGERVVVAGAGLLSQYR